MQKLMYIKETDPNKFQSFYPLLIKFASVEISVHPYIRRRVKTWFLQNGFLKTTPTEEGKKTLDVMHSSYRVKRVEARISDLFVKPYSQMDSPYGDIFLDILQNESRGLI
jgi:hypothetical protein